MYCEAQFINFDRIYVGAKRIFFDRGSSPRTKSADAPRHHQNNVVAYPHNQDGSLTAVGMSHAALAHTITIQFVSGHRQRLRAHPDLSDSVEKLRTAFHLLSVNSLAFMDATKKHALWDSGTFGPTFEQMLQYYIASAGGTSGGAPA